MTAICPHCGFDLKHDEPVTVGRWRYDPRHGLAYDGRWIKLSPACLGVAAALFRARGRILTADVLSERLGSESPTFDNHLRVLLSRIRRAFAAAAAPCAIEWVRGMGARWRLDGGEADVAAVRIAA